MALVIGRVRSTPSGFNLAPLFTPSPLEHALGHLSPAEAQLARVLVEPVTIGQAAERLGISHRAAEYRWHLIRSRLGIRGGAERSGAVGRVALIRIAAGLDECFCA